MTPFSSDDGGEDEAPGAPAEPDPAVPAAAVRVEGGRILRELRNVTEDPGSSFVHPFLDLDSCTDINFSGGIQENDGKDQKGDDSGEPRSVSGGTESSAGRRSWFLTYFRN